MTITFITGANRGLGYETARRLQQAGHTVVLGARDPARGADAAARLGARLVPINVGDDDSVAAAVADVATHEGRIDVLINNAGILGPLGDPAQLTARAVTEVFNVNVLGVVRTTTGFLRLLGRRLPDTRSMPHPHQRRCAFAGTGRPVFCWLAGGVAAVGEDGLPGDPPAFARR